MPNKLNGNLNIVSCFILYDNIFSEFGESLMKARTPTSTNRANLGDVAKQAGVSAMTVSRALSQPDKVALKTRERINSAIEELGYLPNLAAGTLRSDQSRIIAGIVPTISHAVFSETIQGISDGLDDTGYQLLLGSSGYSFEKEEELIKAFLGRQVDGLILTGTKHAPDIKKRLGKADVPVIEIWDISEDRLDLAVGFDNSKIGYEIGRHLVNCGYRRLGYIATSKQHEAVDNRSALRSEGFYKAIQEAGLEMPIRIDVPNAHKMEESGRIAADFVESNPMIEAIFCANDIIGAGTISELKRRSRRIPDQLGIIAMGDTKFSALLNLTSVQIYGYDIGKHAADMLLSRLRGEVPDSPFIDVGFKIIDRGSTRKSGAS
jgi:LacI family gluconate utilization system Gnt-I transcriptional repressor